MEGFEAVLAAGHMGVVIQLAESCVQWEERQDTLMQRLLQVWNIYDTHTPKTKVKVFMG